MATKKAKWVIYEFRDGGYVVLTKPQRSRRAVEKLRDKMIQSMSGRYGKKSLGVARVA